MSLAIYVAGHSSQRERVATVIAAVRGAGHTITYDWPADLGEAPANAGLSDDVRDAIALRCVEAVSSAELVIAVGGAPSTGAGIEIGIALAEQIPVIWLESVDDSIFVARCECVTTIDALVDELRRWSAS